MYGGWSRASEQKSLKIFVRRSYDEVNNKLRYEFFPDKQSACGDGTVIGAYKRLVLRNAGNDNGFGFIRDELFHTLAGQAGFRDYEAVRPAALFINGDYRETCGCMRYTAMNILNSIMVITAEPLKYWRVGKHIR